MRTAVLDPLNVYSENHNDTLNDYFSAQMNSRVPGKENLHLGEDHSIPHRDQTVSVLDEGSVDPTTPPPYMYETSGDVPPAYTASQAPPYTDGKQATILCHLHRF